MTPVSGRLASPRGWFCSNVGSALSPRVLIPPRDFFLLPFSLMNTPVDAVFSKTNFVFTLPFASDSMYSVCFLLPSARINSRLGLVLELHSDQRRALRTPLLRALSVQGHAAESGFCLALICENNFKIFFPVPATTRGVPTQDVALYYRYHFAVLLSFPTELAGSSGRRLP